jgi:hypothetical protein
LFCLAVCAVDICLFFIWRPGGGGMSC